MNEKETSAIWQVDADGRIYEATFDELIEWIGTGSLQPNDKIRKGNLRWIEAGRAPATEKYFAKEQNGRHLSSIKASAESGKSPSLESKLQISAASETSLPSRSLPQKREISESGGSNRSRIESEIQTCENHCEALPSHICQGCGGQFCQLCLKSFGGTVRLCPVCGEMCDGIKVTLQKRKDVEKFNQSMKEGFGLRDLVNALKHPFKFKTSLFFGAAMFTFFSLGQSVSSLGGIFMMVSALFAVLLANMLVFGVLANTVDQFSQGNTQADFMPGFEDFSLWEDVVHPFFLSIGVYVSSFGPFVVVLSISLYMILNTANARIDTFQSEIERIPGTHYYAGRDAVEQSSAVKDVLSRIANERKRQIEQQTRLEENGGNPSTATEQGTPGDLLADARKNSQIEAPNVLGTDVEEPSPVKVSLIQEFLNLAAPMAVLGAITFLWGVFFFPAACAVAGYTRSFAATINPLVGLDTIKRMGFDYGKVLLMYVLLAAGTGFIAVLASLVLHPFDLPMFGNIPAKAISYFFAYYFFIVFSCILGLSLFKASGRLGLLK